MANLPETPDYPAGVYQLETSDPVLGGPGGIANRQAEQLGNRTAWLKDKVDAFLAGTVAVFKATRLATARTLSISGAGSGSASFDGSANANIALTLADSGAVAGTYPKVTINAKGLVTDGAPLSAADIPTSLVLAGSPSAPTPAQFDNSTRLATTEHAALLGLCARPGNGISLVANTTLTLAQSGGWAEFNADNITATLPALATTVSGLAAYTFRANGRKGSVIKADGAGLIHAPGGSLGNTYQLSSHESAMVVSNGPAGDWYLILGGVAGGAFGSSLAANGFKRIADPNSPSGFFIEQWVTGNSDASGNLSLNLPIQFPTAILGGIANEGAPGGWTSTSTTVWGFDINASTLSTVVARVRNIVGANGPVLGNGISGRIRVWGY